MDVDAQSMAIMLQHVKLDRLDLSETHLDEKMIEVLCRNAGEHVTLLILHQCELAQSTFSELLMRILRVYRNVQSGCFSKFPASESMNECDAKLTVSLSAHGKLPCD